MPLDVLAHIHNKNLPPNHGADILVVSLLQPSHTVLLFLYPCLIARWLGMQDPTLAPRYAV